MVVVAIMLGLVAAYGVAVYVKSLKSKAENEQKLVKVLVAQENISAGVAFKDITKKDMASFKGVPNKYRVYGAITSPDHIDSQVLTVPVNKGEQLTADKFKFNSQVGLSFAIPKNQVAISIPVDEVKGVSGMIKAGDFVDIIATLSDQTGTQDTQKIDMTKIILQKVRVIAAGSVIAPPTGRAEEPKTVSSRMGTGQSTKQTVTLSLTPGDAEKLVFAEEKGRVWLTLLPATDAAPAVTGGQTIESVFK
jgi:pilus assembly protein CpaB